MPQLHELPNAGDALPADERLRRYLPADLLEAGEAAHRATQAFVHLAAARYAISTYLPRFVVRQALHERAATPWLRWVDGSLLFADISGSTALAERLGALGREGTEIVTDFLNAIFATMADVVQAFDGDLVAFGGDALLVLFDGPQHARTAAGAALALQEALHGYVRTVPGVGSFPMHLHIGVESGRVAFVSGGSPQELHYSVLGQVVSGVAAAETLAGPGEVALGPRAWAQLRDTATGDELAPGYVRLRGVQAPAPVSPRAVETALDGPAEISRLLDDLDRISPYLPPTLLGRILAAPERPQVEADLRPVTPVFAQVVGLEALAEALPPELAAQVAQRYIGAMQAAVARFGGVVNKLDVADEGIKLVAIFGAPAAYEDHAERAARAALAMQQEIVNVELSITNELGRQQFSIPNSPFPILKQRIGLNLGTAFAGNVGGAARKEYTVMGDAVNVAARVMTAAAWGEVWCSEAVARALHGRLRCEERGAVALKGKATPLALYRVAGEIEAPAGVLAAYRDTGPLVGRARELGWLRTHLRGALAGEGRALRVVGEAGVGKSRLSAALVEEALASGARVVAAACFSYTAGIPYAAWAEWLKALCGIAAGEGHEQRAQKIAARLAALGPGMEEWLPLLGDLARLDVPDNRLTRGLDPQLRQERRFALLAALLLRATEEGPLVALFEDLHWADPISLDLWRHMAGTLAGRRALLLGIHRPAPQIAGDGAHVLELHELSGAESDALLRELSAGAPLPDQLRRELVERSAGNPLFLAELLRAVQTTNDEQLTAREHQGSVAGRSSFVTSLDNLPDSLNGLLLSRIDRLDETSRGVLRVASVIGQRIPFGVLQSVQSADQRALVRQLTRLDEEALTVLERTEPERVHTFRHALVQEVAYQSMLYARRRELHGRIGAYLEQRYANDLDDYVGLLAHHYRLSDRREKAIEYLLKAGHAARDVYANEEAIQSYTWALEALAGDEADPRTWQARDALGDVYATVGRYAEALAQHAAILAAPGVTPEAARRAHRKRGNVLEKQGEYAAALEELERAMAIATSGAPGISPLAVPTICADIGMVRKRRGEFDLAVAACEQGLAALRSDPRTRQDELIEARLHSELGTIYGIRGDYPQARHHIERSLRAREAIDDLPGMVASHNNLGYLWQLQGEHERAIGHYRIAEELARKINLRYALIHAATNAAYALTSLGQYAAAEARCHEALQIARELSAQQTVAQIQNTLGIIYYRTGDYAHALAALDEALRLNRALGSTHDEANALMHYAQVLAALGRLEEARAAAEDALARAEALQAQTLRVETLNVLAEVALARAAPEDAARYAAEAQELATAIGSEDDAGIAQRLAGRAAAALGLPFDAHFAASIARFEHTKDRFELGRSLAAYGAALATHGNPAAGDAYLLRAHDAFLAVGAAGELQRLTAIVGGPGQA
ncbi:MAG TPA: adenylate/guanylate cyclase domain-containing protein [Roseiflexaceae bacterium]|nr:adenylate/guanylate cyclase domain-containing protein [Roseiflexaceae bacterium]